MPTGTNDSPDATRGGSYAPRHAVEHDPDATRVVARRRAGARGSSAAAGSAPKPGDTAAMPGLHEAQQEVQREAVSAQQQAAYPPQGLYGGPHAPGSYSRQDGPVRPQEGEPRYAQPYGQPYPPQNGYAGGYAPPRQVKPVGHGRHLVARFFLAFASWVLRLAAIGVSLVVVLDSFTFATGRTELLRATAAISAVLPQGLAGLYVIDTPFGGAFRGDFAIAALVLFLVDWILCRIRAALR